ncbi:MAG: 16S rRNA (guanine(966)-N(2))-methyltransferase RsmD [Lachnospiraceae bacterium]|nr:16S rRNA (guanine(966)-N(2))-methyltransferase RsmD [Lachnospiraceae bacterium]
MRVIAGTARSMPLRTVKGMDVRPTTDRTKETLFNILQPWIPGSRFLDLFAGSGSIGIEALSRGAECAVFVEKARASQDLILENLEFTKLIGGAKLEKGDAVSVLRKLEGADPFDVIFMDPPFDHGLEKDVLEYLSTSSLPAEDGIIVVEASPKTDFSYLPEMGYSVVKERVYGRSQHIFLRKN